MDSASDPASDAGNSASEPATPVRDTPVNLETLRKADHPTPVRRHSCSSTNRGLLTNDHCSSIRRWPRPLLHYAVLTPLIKTQDCKPSYPLKDAEN
ncbi:nuclear receptor ROR-alpha-like [Erpetoichthys calabaricus]|uniref:nuclear receptor ROR-alpha-like n=1 Tax=Erpetoichthys calabaricus TaxID=27687 RepID=UPI00109F4472|nr:nuclear receptor ROR-alpha-like [Erpetoichthys calabaricus]